VLENLKPGGVVDNIEGIITSVWSGFGFGLCFFGSVCFILLVVVVVVVVKIVVKIVVKVFAQVIAVVKVAVVAVV
jgi:hypothetical protein